ncbi:hypothetical protein BDL97_15G013300 [Sphagnum fallax]|nr:hypothetical protein BDL97_15G013300 [Sphagnum fallax]
MQKMHLISASWRPSTLPSGALSPMVLAPTTDPESTGLISMPPESSLVCCWTMIMASNDITAVALSWAQKNIQSNPSVADLIEVRSSLIEDAGGSNWDTTTIAAGNNDTGEEITHHSTAISDAVKLRATTNPCLDSTDEEVPGFILQGSQWVSLLPSPREQQVTGSEDNGHEACTPAVATKEENCSSLVDLEEVQPFSYATTTSTTTHQKLFPLQSVGSPTVEEGEGAVSSSEAVVDTKHAAILVGVVKEGERFDFCMCNPPFFTSMVEANANPRTACGGTEAEMVYPGGEEMFVARMIEDSATLKHKIHWYTTMIGRKLSLKVLTAKLWTLGVAAVRTTEFVQGHTSRWGLAWSFTAPPKIESSKTSVQIKSNVSFMLEGLRHGCSAVDVLQGLISQLQSNGVLCKLDLSSFSINGVLLNRSNEEASADVPLPAYEKRASTKEFKEQQSSGLTNATSAADHSSLRASVFQQAPGSLLIKASLGKGASFESGKLFMKIFENAEQALKEQFNLKQRRTM